MLRLCRRPLSTFNRVQLRFVHVEQGEWNVWLAKHRLALNDAINDLAVSKAQDAVALYIDQDNWKAYVNKFRRDLINDPNSLIKNVGDLRVVREIVERLNASSPEVYKKGLAKGERRQLFNIIAAECLIELKDVALVNKTLASATDMSVPHAWYPRTRIMKRKIIYHGGPTNSGKTYQALQRLKNANPEKGGGLYCGPLRLLALEVYENLNKAGAFTSLLTGQEKREVPGATHISCTVEMVNINREYDVVVMDEIQMIGDKERGFAWTRVLQGVMANEVHVCGGLEAAEIVESLCKSTGDVFELVKYERMSKLVVAEESLRGDYSKIRPGDCIVAFSKADLFCIKKVVEQMTKFKVGVVYGQLPPETRSAQARRYNSGYYDVLVASDAIGMGLNLNIRRIVFHNTLKSLGKQGVYWVDPSSVKQIAGRAGRMSSDYKVGEVTAWQEADLAYVRAVMQWEIPQIKQVGIFPSVDLVEHFSTHLTKALELKAVKPLGKETLELAPAITAAAAAANSTNSSSSGSNTRDRTDSVEQLEVDKMRLSTVIDRFANSAKTDDRYFLTKYDSLLILSNWLHSIPLTIADKFTFSNAPVNTRSEVTMYRLYHFAATYAQNRPVALQIKLNRRLPRDLEEFNDLCDKHNIIELYLWLSLRFPKFFIEQEICRQMKTYAVNQIERTLQSTVLSESYAYGKEYLKLRERLAKEEQDIYPPEEFGVVRDTAMGFINEIGADVRYVEPPKEVEKEVNRDSGGGYVSSFGYRGVRTPAGGAAATSASVSAGKLPFGARSGTISDISRSAPQSAASSASRRAVTETLQAREDRRKKEIERKKALFTAPKSNKDEELEKMVEMLAITD